MCLPKPGPRCHGHAVAKVDSLQDSLETANEERYKAEVTASKLMRKYPRNYEKNEEWQAAIKISRRAGVTIPALERKIKEAEDESDATVGGIASLEKRMSYLNPDWTSDVDEYTELRERHTKAIATYERKLKQYDQERGTVRGRNPSPYGSQKGINILAGRKNDLYRKAGDSTGEKSEKYHARALALEDQLKHARDTRAHAQAGITDTPSASLVENKETLKSATKQITEAKEKYARNNAIYSNDMLSGMQKIEAEQKKAGRTSRSKWPAATKREYAMIEETAEEFRSQKVVPFIYRTQQLEDQVTKLERQIELGSITAKERAANKLKGRN